MSEANILNPTSDSLLSPNYAYSEGLPETHLDWQADSGAIYTREMISRGRIYELAWEDVDKATMHTLRQFARQYRRDFHTFVDWERTRYFSGRLYIGDRDISPAQNDKWNIRGRFVEMPGLALNTYPSNWARDAIFLEERNGLGEDVVKQTGVWTQTNDANAHGGAYKENAGTVVADLAEWLYFGYGCQLYALKKSNFGIGSFKITRQRDGVVVSGPTDVDCYAAATQAAAALVTVTNLALDWYRVSFGPKNPAAKNAGSSDFKLPADALQVMV